MDLGRGRFCSRESLRRRDSVTASSSRHALRPATVPSFLLSCISLFARRIGAGWSPLSKAANRSRDSRFGRTFTSGELLCEKRIELVKRQKMYRVLGKVKRLRSLSPTFTTLPPSATVLLCSLWTSNKSLVNPNKFIQLNPTTLFWLQLRVRCARIARFSARNCEIFVSRLAQIPQCN